jgi:Domain of unknown function (DUF4399)/Family of unknown function (DUF6130)
MKQLALVALIVLVAACSSGTPESSKPASSAPAASPGASTPAAKPAGGPRVFFVEPADGATVKSPVHLRFGADNFMIMAVPEKVETVREGMGHYHVGVDTECLAPGTEIVKGTPTWIHFGKAESEIDMQLTPGKHTLVLQIGDDKHVTLPGLCSTISVNVAQ